MPAAHRGEVLTGTGRRRRCSAGDNGRIMAESHIEVEQGAARVRIGRSADVGMALAVIGAQRVRR